VNYELKARAGIAVEQEELLEILARYRAPGLKVRQCARGKALRLGHACIVARPIVGELRFCRLLQDCWWSSQACGGLVVQDGLTDLALMARRRSWLSRCVTQRVSQYGC